MHRKIIDESTVMEEDHLKKIAVGNFQSRSEAAQEIISRKPDFIEKWALLVFMLLLLLLLAGGTWFIRYPDIVQARATLAAYNGPKEIIPLQTGRLVKLFVKNGETVKKNETIGWIESTANTEEVLQLSAQLDSSVVLLSQGKPEKVSALSNRSFEDLGELQTAYQTYIAALQQFNDYFVNGFYPNQKKMLVSDINSIYDMDSSLEKQRQLTQKDNDLSEKSFKMNEQLYKEKVISLDEYRTQQSKLINKQMAVPQINTNILSNKNQQRDKLKELQQLDHDVAQQKITFEQALQTLKSNVDDWLHKYTIQSPSDGVVSFISPIQQNQFITQGKLMGYTNPPDSKFYAEIYLPQNNLGKIDTGMQVQLRFDAYPYQEVGFVKGKLDYISKVASDSGFLATVRLDNGLLTNLHNTIQYKSGLKADALVITQNMRLLKRMYFNIVKATSVGK